jgi:hypothetical protein
MATATRGTEREETSAADQPGVTESIECAEKRANAD